MGPGLLAGSAAAAVSLLFTPLPATNPSEAPILDCAWRTAAQQLAQQLQTVTGTRAQQVRAALAASGITTTTTLPSSCTPPSTSEIPDNSSGSTSSASGPNTIPDGHSDAPSPTPTPSPQPPRSASTTRVPTPDHVLIVVMENENAQSVIGGTEAPYLTELARRSANFTDAHAESHPSQPNYLALFSGTTQGVSDDSCIRPLGAVNLGSQIEAAGKSFVGYSEDLPSPGFTGCTAGSYARKHAPWAVFSNLSAANNQPYSALPANFSQLPTVAFVIPNLCNDMHDCGVSTGDQWLQTHIAPYESWARTHNSLLITTWDESADNSGDNHIATLISGARVQPGNYTEKIDHYRLLRTLEDAFGLGGLGSAAQTQPITDIWTGPPTPPGSIPPTQTGSTPANPATAGG